MIECFSSLAVLKSYNLCWERDESHQKLRLSRSGLLHSLFFFLPFCKRVENRVGSVDCASSPTLDLCVLPLLGGDGEVVVVVFVSLHLNDTCLCLLHVYGRSWACVFLLFRASNFCFLCCKKRQSGNNTKYNGDLTVLQIVGTCLALCLSSDLKSLSVVTEVSASGASEVSYFQVSWAT